MTLLTVTRQTGEGVASPLIVALEDVWAQIRLGHPEIPAAILIIGSGSGSRHGELLLGQFAAGRWQPGDSAGELDEVFIGGEGLRRGAGPVLATVLHEAAHALARARQIQDTSRQGRYHNRRFRALAEELGLAIARDPSIGWSKTTLPESTARRYAPAIAALEHAITITRRRERQSAPTDRKPGARGCVCGCGRRIRVAPGVLALGEITCGICSHPFKPQI